jgi:hypothetical protein
VMTTGGGAGGVVWQAASNNKGHKQAAKRNFRISMAPSLGVGTRQIYLYMHLTYKQTIKL